jgi:hypothetical protein
MSASSFATQTLTHKTQERVKYVTSLCASRTTLQVVEIPPSRREK